MQRQAEGVASLSLEEHSPGAPPAGGISRNGEWGPSHGESVHYAEPPDRLTGRGGPPACGQAPLP